MAESEQGEALEERWQRAFDRKYPGKEFKATTRSGIALKPVYGAEDIEGISQEDIGLPGLYSYTRGIYPVQYQFQAFKNQLVHGYGLPEHTRERMDLLTKEGMTGYFGERIHNLAYDLVSQNGYDPDDPAVEGKAGLGGVAVYSARDMEALFHDMPLDRSAVVHIVREPSMVMLAMYIVAAERMGFAQEQLRGNSMNACYSRPFWDTVGFPPKNTLKLMVELVKYCTNEMPSWNTTNFTGYVKEEAGATAIQEVAFTLAAHIALVGECMKAGLTPSDFIPRFSFQMAHGNDFFEEIAKIRALRRMWAKINKERFGCEDARSLQARIYSQTAGSALTAQQPLNNVVRAALHTLGAVLAGTNAVQTASYDEALSIPSEEAATLALRTQQIVLEETNIPNVSDPLGGSYYVEWLTSRFEQEVYGLLSKIEERGGYVRCWESGWLKAEVVKSAYEWRERVNRCEEIVIGLNKYAVEEQQRVPAFSYSPNLQRIAIERVQRLREQRDNAKTMAALEKLSEEARSVEVSNEGKGYLMPAIIEAARADATLGEMMAVLRQVFGWGYW